MDSVCSLSFLPPRPSLPQGAHRLFQGFVVFLVITPLVSGIPDTPPADCPGCVSHKWQCDRKCMGRGNTGESRAFDWTYEHKPNTCQELIPYNGSKMQIDVDLWCSYPGTQTCRTAACRAPVIGCDNMNEVFFYGLSFLQGCNSIHVDGEKLLIENCNWVCKHFRPFARCTVQFDPLGMYRLSHNLEACWVQETCANDEATGVEVTCKPKSGEPSQVIEVSGVFQLDVEDASSWMSNPSTTTALKEALASSLVGVSADMVKIDSVVASRRLGLSESLSSPPRLLRQAFSVAYRIVATERVAAAITTDLASTAMTTKLASAIVTTLASEGVSAADVAVSGIATPATQVLTSQGELASIRSLIKAMDEHLKEAMTELNATWQTLTNKTLTENTTLKELQDLQTAHRSAADRLSQLMTSHDTMQAQLQNTSQNHNSSYSRLNQALAEKAIASSKLQDANAAWRTAQQMLHTARLKTNSTQDALDEAQLTHSSTAKELEDLKAKHSLALTQLAAMTELRDAAESSRTEASAALATAEEREDLALDQNKRTRADLESATASSEALEQQLSSVTANITGTRSDLWMLLSGQNATLRRARSTIEQVLKAHREVQEQLAAEQAEHKKTQQFLDEERWAHDETRKELEDENEARSGSNVALGLSVTLLLIACVLICSLCGVYRYRKPWLFSILHLNRPEAGVGDVIVVGRPLSSAPGDGSGVSEKGFAPSTGASTNLADPSFDNVPTIVAGVTRQGKHAPESAKDHAKGSIPTAHATVSSDQAAVGARAQAASQGGVTRGSDSMQLFSMMCNDV